MKGKNGELSDEELDNVSGGANCEEAELSVSTSGIGCIVMAIKSAFGSGVGDGPDGKILCNDG